MFEDLWQDATMLVLRRQAIGVRPCVETCLVSHRLRLVYAYVPKAACTSIKTWLVRHARFAPELLAEIISAEAGGRTPKSKGYPNVHEHLDQHYSLRQSPVSEVQSLLRDSRYFKFTFVRHPLARLVSAYLDKVVWAKAPARRIIRNHQSGRGHFGWQQAARWLRREVNIDAERSLTFREFVSQLACENPERLNAHFRSQSRLLRSIPLDMIGRVENSLVDFRRVQNYLGIMQPLTSRNKTEYAAVAQAVFAADWPATDFRGSAPAPAWQSFFDAPLLQAAEQLYEVDFAFGYEPSFHQMARRAA